jgi:hypothetical protein
MDISGVTRFEHINADNVIRFKANSAQIPVGTTSNRPAGEAGLMRYNTSTGNFEGYNLSSWGVLGGGEIASFTAGMAFDKANTANITADVVTNVANLAFNKANTANTTADVVTNVANLAFNKANTTNITADFANTGMAAAFAKANAALANTSGVIFAGNINLVGNANAQIIRANTLVVANSTTGNVFIGVETGNTKLFVMGSAAGKVQSITDNTSIVIPLHANNNFSVNVGGSNTIINPVVMEPGQSGIIFINQDAVGSRIVSWGSAWRFPSGEAPTLTTTASATDAIVYMVRSNTSIVCQSMLNVG